MTSSAHTKLSADGKPMRALRALAVTNAYEPLAEYGVYLVARRDERETGEYHQALKSLVALGLAERCGRRGGYQWFITDAGRVVLNPGEKL